MTSEKIRRSQLLTTYGVGSLVPFADGLSYMVLGTDKWADLQDLEIHEFRLEQIFRGKKLRLPSIAPRVQFGARNTAPQLFAPIPVVRFPTFASCPECHRLDHHWKLDGRNDDAKCTHCAVRLVPSRFIVACENGHIDEFPYMRWVHGGPQGEGDHQLHMRSSPTTSSLEAIQIECSCGATRNLGGIFDRESLTKVTRCYGNRPWLGPQETCTEPPRTLLRGASNVWFPVVRSAISIPPWSDAIQALIARHWNDYRILCKLEADEALREFIVKHRLVERAGVEATVDDVLALIKSRFVAEGRAVDDPQALRRDEFDALCRGRTEESKTQEFVCDKRERLGSIAGDLFEQIMLVHRLREVRALEAFTRVSPPHPSDPETRRQKLWADGEQWKPVIEVVGEGVFFRLSDQKLASWEQDADVRKRAARIDAQYLSTFAARGTTPDRNITPRLILTHSFAHLLINEWSLMCGYPAASLRERLYVDDDHAGFLLYTATSDSSGSLGGIVDLAESDLLEAVLDEACKRAAWCSADPLCIESDASGVDSLSLAACHSCMLLPEVSCEESNCLLDRAMLIGTVDKPDMGYLNHRV
jgi:hypothetical protein